MSRVPAVSKIEAIEDASPIHSVEIGASTKFMASKIASAEGIHQASEFMYMLMLRIGACDSNSRNFATISDDTSSSIPPVNIIIRSRCRNEDTSHSPPSPLCSELLFTPLFGAGNEGDIVGSLGVPVTVPIRILARCVPHDAVADSNRLRPACRTGPMRRRNMMRYNRSFERRRISCTSWN